MNIFQNSATRFAFVVMVITLCGLTIFLAITGNAEKFAPVFDAFKVTMGGIVVYFTAKSTQESANIKSQEDQKSVKEATQWQAKEEVLPQLSEFQG